MGKDCCVCFVCLLCVLLFEQNKAHFNLYIFSFLDETLSGTRPRDWSKDEIDRKPSFTGRSQEKYVAEIEQEQGQLGDRKALPEKNDSTKHKQSNIL